MNKVLISILFLLCACGPPTSQTDVDARQAPADTTKAEAPSTNTVDVEPSPSPSPLQAFALDPFDPPIGYSMVLRNASEKLLERFGNPVDDSSSAGYDRTGDAKLIERTLGFDGVVFVVGETEDRTLSWLESITVTGERHLLQHGLGIGATRENVMTSLKPELFIEGDHQITMSIEIWEERTDTLHRPGEVVRVNASMALTFELNSNDEVTKVIIESIGF